MKKIIRLKFDHPHSYREWEAYPTTLGFWWCVSSFIGERFNAFGELVSYPVRYELILTDNQFEEVL